MLLNEQPTPNSTSSPLDDLADKGSRGFLEKRFDDIVYIAASLLDCSLAMITTTVQGKPIVALAMQDDGDQKTKIVPDPQRMLDPIDAENVGLPFYCGFPLRSSTGQSIGHLALYDVTHRKVTQGELDMLLRLARIASALLENSRTEH